MNVASFIARRLVWQQGPSFSRFIIRLSVVATAISVAVMIVTLAFVAGFQQTISKKVFSFWGHIRVQQQVPTVGGLAEEQPSLRSDSINSILQQAPDVAAVDVFATKSALLRSNESIEGVLLKGLDTGYNRGRLLPFLLRGSWLPFSTAGTAQPILISEYTARQLALDTGSRAYLYFLDAGGNTPRVRPVQVCGIYKTAIEEYDKTFALVHMGLIQSINGWSSNQIGGYEVTLRNYQKDKIVQSSLLDALPVSWYSATIRDLYPNIFDWLHLQNTNRQIIIAVMCLVAVINLISCLLILVLERSRMIGLLKAIGATDGLIQQIFWRQALIITAAGLLLGNLLGLGFCWLQHTTGFIQLDEAAYYMRTAPVLVQVVPVLLVNLITFAVSFIILLIPSLLVRTITPVKALRFE